MRNPIFDIMKFVAIIAMIAGHCVHDWRRPWIYIWHMPLFFMVSGYFFKPRKFSIAIKNSAKKLLLPYASTAIVIFMLTLIEQYWIENNNFVTDKTISILLSGGIGSIEYPHGFAIWFLIALFLCNTLYTILHNTYHDRTINLSLSVIGITLTTYLIIRTGTTYAPFALLQVGMSIMFFHIGYMYHIYASTPSTSTQIILLLLSILAAIGSEHYGGLEMYCSQYPNLALNILGAVGGTYIIMQLSYFLCRTLPTIAVKVAQVGAISILILAVHSLDYEFNLSPFITRNLLFFIDDIEPNIAERILFALIASLLLYKLPIVRKIFGLSKHKYIDIK